MGKKCLFICYPEHSKSYVFIGENQDGSISIIESRNVTYLDNDFQTKGEMQNDFQFLEMDDLVNGSHHNKSLENIHDLSDSSFINSKHIYDVTKVLRQDLKLKVIHFYKVEIFFYLIH